jgi:hypothetical protein
LAAAVASVLRTSRSAARELTVMMTVHPEASCAVAALVEAPPRPCLPSRVAGKRRRLRHLPAAKGVARSA